MIGLRQPSPLRLESMLEAHHWDGHAPLYSANGRTVSL